MRIFIDNQEADLDARTNVSISLSVASHTDLTASRTGYSKTITLPMTARNMAIMGDTEQINAVSAFNKTPHSARIEQDGCVVIEGTPFLAESASHGAGGHYRLHIIGPGKQWATLAAQTPLRQLGVPFAEKLDATTILQSWTWDKPVRFLPVQRDGFEPDNFAGTLTPPQKILTIEDYHPFLHVGSMVAKIFDDAGYAVKSDFLAGPLFNSLYMSGNYPTKDIDRLKARMNFRAGRFAAAEAVADSLGRVYANPFSTLNSVGNIVDTADPDEERGGRTLNGVYSVGDYFRINGGQVEFAPPVEVTVGFEYALHYTSAYKILNRTTLRGFSKVNLMESQEREYELLNPHVDRRGDLRGNKTYTAIVFDHVTATAYQLTYWEVTNPAADLANLKSTDYVAGMAGTFNVRTLTFTLPVTSNRIVNPRLLYRKTTTYVEYTGDWAIYDGSVAVAGTIDVELVVRTTPERILPSKPKKFDLISFGGAEAGMSFKLGNRTTLKPYFVYHPGEGAALDFETVAAHNISCLDLVNGLKQMFNLHFFTDQLSRTVYIEPRTEFYRTDVVVDLTDRMDLSRPVVVSELGDDMSQTLSFQYAAGDDAVTAWNRQWATRLGQWTARIENRFAADTVRSYENPVFAPSVSARGGFPNAASALLLQAGIKDAAGEKSDELNFPPKIARYLGMTALPTGQLWGWPGNEAKYPLVTFHYAGDANPYEGTTPNPLSTFGGDAATLLANGLSLCFEDRDGVAGLHRFYDGNISLLNRGKRVQAYVLLRPEDVEPLISPDSRRRDFRALYRLALAGESALFRLEQVCDYNPAIGAPTKCVFVKEV